ncbi:MAG: hypothetical protein JWN85_1499 [Gammaproteobacteria bacterium]|nr:hypothetical protein [Gammaproteobacteria bacterium]
MGRDIATVCTVNAPDEAVAFDPASITMEPTRADEEYAGVRVTFEARLGTIRDRLQVDVGFGDALWPHAEELAYPVALGEAASILRTYRPETVIAEKVEAIVALGIRNSRIKDFFDVDYLARTEWFDRATLIEAIRRTFERRAPIPTHVPIGLTPELWTQPGRDAQVRAFSRRARLDVMLKAATDLGLRGRDVRMMLEWVRGRVIAGDRIRYIPDAPAAVRGGILPHILRTASPSDRASLREAYRA